MIKKWLRKRRAKAKIFDNAVLIAKTLGEPYDTWEAIGVSSKRKPGDILPPLPPVSGYQYRDELVWIVIDSSIVGYSATIESPEQGHWAEVYSTDNIGGVFRLNYGEWVEHIMEIAEELRGKQMRAGIARFASLEDR